jgi:sugar lactone lactonase YvrE
MTNLDIDYSDNEFEGDDEVLDAADSSHDEKDEDVQEGKTIARERKYHALVGGALKNKHALAAKVDRGVPDGSCLDTDGHLWNCRVGGGACVACFRADGSLDRLVDLPCSWPTSCTFGGAGFATLFVTSARFTMSKEHLATHPGEGAVFALSVGARGQPEHRFGRQ